MACIRMTPTELAAVIEKLRDSNTSKQDVEGFEKLFYKVIPVAGALDKIKQLAEEDTSLSNLELAQIAFSMNQ